MLEGLRTLGQAALDWRSKDAHTPEEALLQTLVKVDEADRYTGLLHLHLTQDAQGRWTLSSPTYQDVDEQVLRQALWEVSHGRPTPVQQR